MPLGQLSILFRITGNKISFSLLQLTFTHDFSFISLNVNLID